jgi:hypothetical protein
MKNKQSNSGQFVLMVLLTMVVGLTIALAIFTNSLTDTAVTITQQNSEKAFSLAEANIEKLLAGEGEESVLVDNFMVTGSEVAETEFEAFVKQNAGATIKLIDESGNPTGASSVDVYWTLFRDPKQDPRPTDCHDGNSTTSPAGLLVNIWKKSGSTVTVEQRGYTPYSCNGNAVFASSGLSNSNGALESTGYVSTVNIPVDSDTIMMRVRPIYNDATIYVRGNVALPVQQTVYTSSAYAEGSLETRKIEVVKTEPDLPDIFDYVLFSKGTLIQD